MRSREYQEDGSERYQLDVNPCDCQDAGELEEQLDEFPDDVIRAEWKESTDSNEAESEEDSEEYGEFQQGNESEEETDTTTFQEEDPSSMLHMLDDIESEDERVTNREKIDESLSYESYESNGESREKKDESSSYESFESNDQSREKKDDSSSYESFETNELSGAERSGEDEFADERKETSFSKSRNRRRKHSRISRTQTRNGIKIKQEETNYDSDDVTKKESNESFESGSEEKSTSNLENNVTGKTDEPVIFTTLAEDDKEEETTKNESSDEEEKTTEHEEVEPEIEMTEMPSNEVNDLFNAPSSESESSEDKPPSSVQTSTTISKDDNFLDQPFMGVGFTTPKTGGNTFEKRWKRPGLGNNRPVVLDLKQRNGRRGNSLSAVSAW